MNWGPLCLSSPKLTFHMAELFYLIRYIHFLKMEIRYIPIFSSEVSQVFMVSFSWHKATLKNLDSALLYKVVIGFFFFLFTVKIHHNHDFLLIQLTHYENWNDLCSWERYLSCRRVCDIYWITGKFHNRFIKFCSVEYLSFFFFNYIHGRVD